MLADAAIGAIVGEIEGRSTIALGCCCLADRFSLATVCRRFQYVAPKNPATRQAAHRVAIAATRTREV